jgi:hypothetical protein
MNKVSLSPEAVFSINPVNKDEYLLTFFNLSPIKDLQLEDFYQYLLQHHLHDGSPKRLLYNFQPLQLFEFQSFRLLKPMFGWLSDHEQTRAAFWAPQDEFFLEIYAEIKLSRLVEVGQSEVFLSLDQAQAWLKLTEPMIA